MFVEVRDKYIKKRCITHGEIIKNYRKPLMVLENKEKKENAMMALNMSEKI